MEMNCPECDAPLEVLIRGWPSLVQPGLFVMVRTCWECGFKRAVHVPLTFRPATLADSHILFLWANDPHTRKNSFTPEPILRADHEAWLRVMVGPIPITGMPGSRFFIAEIRGIPVGTIRWLSEISITVAPEWRGIGIGAAMLALAPMPPNITARVQGKNGASRKAFERAGWTIKEVIYERAHLS